MPLDLRGRNVCGAKRGTFIAYGTVNVLESIYRLKHANALKNLLGPKNMSTQLHCTDITTTAFVAK